MRELPIIMNGDSVRAILAGVKTQTRRVITPQPEGGECAGGKLYAIPGQPCEPGDLLWVRESYMFWDWTEYGEPFIKYEADGAVRLCQPSTDETTEKWENIWAELSDMDNYSKHKGAARDNAWRTPMFMFKDLARIWLRVTKVRAEQVQDITAGDAMAESVATTRFWNPAELEGSPFEEKWWDDYHFWTHYPQKVYAKVWNGLNAKRGYPWEANPWVWVYKFDVERRRK